MGKKVDLNKKNTNSSNTRRNKNTNQRTSSNSGAHGKGAEANRVNSKNPATSNNPSNNNEKGDNLAENIVIKAKIWLKRKVVLIALIALSPLIFIILLANLVVLMGDGDANGIGGFAGNFYGNMCSEVTVEFVDKNNDYEITDVKTFTMDEYVAGVVVGEVGSFPNIEIAKSLAVAARTYATKQMDESCTIESSARKQVMKDITDNNSSSATLARQAAEETSGIVILKDDKLLLTEYDAFACIDVDSNYYTLSQQNQKIPVEWVNQFNLKSNWLICDGFENMKNHHGRGMSQYGAYYLASEEGYTYDQILAYYYGEDIILASEHAILDSVAGLDIKTTTKAKHVLEQPLSEFLFSKGSSIEQFESFIKDNVNSAGAGTREGVVTAAVSFINFMYDNFNTKLPYYWGGKYAGVGVKSSFGSYNPSNPSRNGNRYYYTSFDCSGFVQWAIINGGFKNPGTGTSHFHSKFKDQSCNVSESSCVGSVGDIINYPSGHVMLIVAVDEASGNYVVAESTNSGVVMQTRGIHKNNKKGTYRVLFMDQYYNDPANINQEYPS